VKIVVLGCVVFLVVEEVVVEVVASNIENRYMVIVMCFLGVLVLGSVVKVPITDVWEIVGTAFVVSGFVAILGIGVDVGLLVAVVEGVEVGMFSLQRQPPYCARFLGFRVSILYIFGGYGIY